MDRFESLSKIAQNEFGITIKSKSPTRGTFESLYCETKDSDRMEKQIEAIAKAMCSGCPDNKECMHSLCADWYKAESIYNAGYRKQSEVIAEFSEAVKHIAEGVKFKNDTEKTAFIEMLDDLTRVKIKGAK